MLAVETEQDTEVSCVILPLRTVPLVVPAACVAEVLPWRAPAPLADVPRWCVGTVDWHGARVPVVDHELLEAADGANLPAAGRCLAVLNRTLPGTTQPFYALMLHGVPRLVQLAQLDVTVEAGPKTAGELLRIDVGTERLAVPDLALVEARVSELASALTGGTVSP